MRNESWLRLMSSLVLVGVFAAGALVGAGVMRFTGESPASRPPPGPIEAMHHELALDREQAEALHAIIEHHQADLDAIVRDAQPKIRTVLYAIEDELRPRLRPEQVQKLEAWRARRGAAPLP
jgi:hypothetical protein